MPSPCPAAYSPKEVMYYYYHPHLTLVPGLMTYLVASPTSDSASISPEGLLSLILLLVVIIATVVVMVVIVVAIVGVLIVVAVIGVVVVVGGVSFIIKLSFMVIGFFLGTILLFQETFKFRPGDLIGFFYSNRLVDLTGDEDLTDEDGDTGMGDSTGVSVSLGGGISLGGNKFWELSIGESGNIEDGGKTSGEMASEAKRYLDKLSEESGEMFLGEAGKPSTEILSLGESNIVLQRFWEKIKLANIQIPDTQTSQTVHYPQCFLSCDDWMPMTLIWMNLNQPRLASWRMLPKEWSDALPETETEITSDSNIIPYSQYLSETQQETV
ncbi:hypothetical protein Tco_1102232 [Tanacetum coccineum]